MYKPRLIPVLLLHNQGLVKSIQFKNHRYIGDPINAVKIFNDLGADELTFLDIDATKQNKKIDIQILKNISEEANMPFSYGGGISALSQIEEILKSGVERVILGTIAATKPSFVEEASKLFGASSICVCVDVKKSFFGKEKVYVKNGSIKTDFNPLEFSKLMQDKGVGELIIQSVDRDGTKSGYNIELIKEISESVNIPIVALGGSKNIEDMKTLYEKTVINGFGAGSMFVYHGNRDGILINYPNKDLKKTLWTKK
jgi:cyclase